MTTTTEPDWLTIEETADLMRLEGPGALYVMNVRGTAPPRYKVGRRVLYRRHEVLEWMEGRRVESGQQIPTPK